jgi:hypothetical protein
VEDAAPPHAQAGPASRPYSASARKIAATAQDLDLLRAFLCIVDSLIGTDALAAEGIEQVHDTAFKLEDVADECCYISGHHWGWVNVRAWFARTLAETAQVTTARESSYPHERSSTASGWSSSAREASCGFCTNNLETRETKMVNDWLIFCLDTAIKFCTVKISFLYNVLCYRNCYSFF